jgi:uncharacterized protein YdiU (UPF0061 family)
MRLTITTKLTGIESLCCHNHYAALPEGFYTRQVPSGIRQPKLVSVNNAVLALIGLDPCVVESPHFLPLCSGNWLPDNFSPLAMKYAGHQFGQYNPDLGDGRGLLLAQIKGSGSATQTWDLHLKGAGQTPYSRQGDGRAILRSSIREYLCSAAMQGLGIPTTQALSLVVGSDAVMREQPEPVAMVLRVAESHIRFGHFEHFYYTQQWDELKLLLDYTLKQHFPQSLQDATPYLSFFRQVIKSTAELMAHWQSVGFVHGVMNTDNMSILGQTFDYGPFAFQDNFETDYVCNHIDYAGRYAFNQQPQVGYWNLMALGRALTPLIDVAELNDALAAYDDLFLSCYRRLMRAKLGLTITNDGDGDLIKQLLAILASNNVDFSYFFRLLSDFKTSEGSDNSLLRDLFINRDEFEHWSHAYTQRLQLEPSRDDVRKVQMDRVNPKYILRNYLAQQALTKAESGDYTDVNQLLEVLSAPFDVHPEYEQYTALPPDWGRKMILSCSS